MRRSAVKLNDLGSGARSDHRHGPLGGLSKRAVDVTLAVLTLVLLAPLLVAICVLIRLLVGKPIIVADPRIGLGGKVFARYRFRTTPSGSTRLDCRWEASIVEVLRASGLDRLPQVCNVLRGDMSWVGPQFGPEDTLNDNAKALEVLWARPGLTGLHHHVPRDLRARAVHGDLDRIYVRHWSMWLDLKIAFGALARVQAEDTITPIR